MGIIFGSARIDENGNITGGRAGDQTGSEVSTQPYYMHSGGWVCLRPKDANMAERLATSMLNACNNPNWGYDQSNRQAVTMVKRYGSTKAVAEPCETDCGNLVRGCVLEASGRDVGEFYTGNEASVLEASGLFNKRFTVTSEGQLYNGDVLVTASKGHTVIVVSGRSRVSSATTNWKATGTMTCQYKDVNVRSTPDESIDTNIIGHLGMGNRVEINGEKSGEWYKVKVAGIGIGWVHGHNLKLDGAQSATQSVKADSAKSFAESVAGTYKVTGTGSEGLCLRSGREQTSQSSQLFQKVRA